MIAIQQPSGVKIAGHVLYRVLSHSPAPVPTGWHPGFRPVTRMRAPPVTRRFKRRETEIMPFHLIRRPLIAAALPAARQPGPVTLAIRDVRPDQPSSWPLLDRQIEEERRAIEALRRRIALGGAL